MKQINICQETIKVLIVDDQRLIRETLGIHLDTQANIEVLDSVNCGVDALEQIDKLNPDIAIVDLEMPGMSGITTIEIIGERFPTTKAIVLSSHGKKEFINQAITAGAKGYLIKGATPAEIARTIEKVHLDQFQFDPKLGEDFHTDNAADKAKPDFESTTSKVLEHEENIPFIQTKVEVVDSDNTTTKVESDQESFNQREFRKIRHDLMGILEFKANLASKQKQQIQAKYQKLQTRFSWLVVSQVILFIVTLGCISSLTQIQGKVTNLQSNINSTDSVQSVK